MQAQAQSLPHPRQRRQRSVLKHHYAVLARLFGLVEGFVGAAEQGGEAFLAGFAADDEADGDPAGQHVGRSLRRVG